MVHLGFPSSLPNCVRCWKRQFFQQGWQGVRRSPSECSAELPGPKGRTTLRLQPSAARAVGMRGLVDNQLTQGVEGLRGADMRLGLSTLTQVGGITCYLRTATIVRL